MSNDEKMIAAERQELILLHLEKSNRPITGSEFSDMTNVSRQVIVQDISILKAKEAPILATNRGYLLENKNENNVQHIIAVNHTPEQTQEELNIIVDNGVTVKDVTVEHALYGEITASVMVSNRMEVRKFVDKINETEALYLSTLTDGIHLHTLKSDSMDKIEVACKDLSTAGILL